MTHLLKYGLLQLAVLLALWATAPLAVAETGVHHHHDHHPIDKTIRKTKAWFHRHL